MTSYSVKDPGQHWFSLLPSGSKQLWPVIHEFLGHSPQKAISQEMSKLYILHKSLKITGLNLHLHIPGTNELITTEICICCIQCCAFWSTKIIRTYTGTTTGQSWTLYIYGSSTPCWNMSYQHIHVHKKIFQEKFIKCSYILKPCKKAWIIISI